MLSIHMLNLDTSNLGLNNEECDIVMFLDWTMC